MSCPGTPEAGYSTIDPKLLRVLLEAQPKSEERPAHDSRMKELFEAAIKQAEDDVQVRSRLDWLINHTPSIVSTWLQASRALTLEEEIRKKRLHTKYSQMAKDLEKDSWMYPTVEDIMKGRSKPHPKS